jgi:thymidylate kinase/thymidylate synthase ThyX
MNTGRGVFVVIEGTDGSGKGTQFKLLADRLTRSGYEVATFDFPQYELPSSYFVREYLNGKYGSIDDVGPYTSSLFYALDRFEAAAQIKEALEQGKVVLANRYVGSNMAHQGTKFDHPEERRGYFIWLDNLEFEMLKLPRPTTSFVLRVPAETAYKLIEQRESDNTKKRDLHEASLGHLQKALTVYDDMCQLFPKDFARLDCTREEKLLPVETIHDIIWQKVEPILPSKKTVRKVSAATAEASLPQSTTIQTPADINKTQNDRPPQPPKQVQEKPQNNPAVSRTSDIHLGLRGISSLTAKKLEWSRLASYAELPTHVIDYDHKDEQGKYRYYIPYYLEAKLQEQYRAYMDQIFNLYAEMVAALSEHLKNTSGTPKEDQTEQWLSSVRMQAIETVRAVLPVAATTTVGVQGSAKAIESVISSLLSNPLPEVYEAGKALLLEARQHTSSFMGSTDLAADLTYRTATAKRLAAVAKKYLPDQYPVPSASVQLVHIWPRNELDLVADMLYERSSISLNELAHITADWPYERKVEVFGTYMGNRSHRDQRPGRALEKAHYTWDLVCEFDTFRDLQRHQMVDDLEWQELTPRYGYDVPTLIEEADLADQFEACFDLSLRLHSLLQESGYVLEAQYATLLGHKIRWQVTYNAREAFHLHELRTGAHNRAEVRKLVLDMHQKLEEKHPLIAEAMKFVGKESS